MLANYQGNWWKRGADSCEIFSSTNFCKLYNLIAKIFCFVSLGVLIWQRRSQNVALPANLLDKSGDQDSESAPEFCIDAGHTGNIARFINHCCEPNLFVQCVLSTHHDLKLARVMLFAADNIPPLQVHISRISLGSSVSVPYLKEYSIIILSLIVDFLSK